ncbi:MAG: alpha/beta hydrolase [Janthinobacterium lividum]
MLFKRLAIGLGIYLVVLFSVAGVMVSCFHPDAPKALHSVTDPFASMDLSNLPSLRRYRARDGAELSYREYPGRSIQVVVLVHGSAGSSQDMHIMARALQEQSGATVLVPDIRGHGANLPHGDIAHVGQLDDDMTDFVQAVRPQHAGKKWTLLGFSSGGGFVLRIAGSGAGNLFDRFILLSPYLRYNAPTVRPTSTRNNTGEGSSWYSVSIARIIGLSIFDFFGIHSFDGLPVLSFPVPTNIQATTSSYSFRMQKNFEPHSDYRADIRNVTRPMQVFVGGSDELFIPEQFPKVFSADRKDVQVSILPGMCHSDMITKPAAISAVVKAVEQTS